MAKPLNPLQPLPGVSDMRFLFEILSNRDLLEESLKSIEEARERANERIALVGPAEEIQAMHARQLAAEKESAERLELAKAEAAKLVAAGQAQADEIVTAATELEAGVKAAQAKADAATADAEKAIAAAKAETAGVAAREERVRAAGEEAARITREAIAAREAYEAKLKQVQEMLAGLSAPASA